MQRDESASDVWVVSVVDRRGEAGNVHGVFDSEQAALDWRRDHRLQLMAWELVIVQGLVLNDPDMEPEDLEDPLYVQPRPGARS